MSTLTHDMTTESVAPNGRIQRFRGGLAVLLSTAAILSTSVAATPTASAYSQSGGVNYSVSAISPMYVNTAQSSASRLLAAPLVTVRSTLASGTSQWQTVRGDFVLQYWNAGTNSWKTAATRTRTADLNAGQSVTLVGDSFGPWPRGFFYRTVVSANWTTHSTTYTGARDRWGTAIGVQTDTLTGIVVFYPSTSADQRCNVGYCTSYAGSVWVG